MGFDDSDSYLVGHEKVTWIRREKREHRLGLYKIVSGGTVRVGLERVPSHFPVFYWSVLLALTSSFLLLVDSVTYCTEGFIISMTFFVLY